MKYLFLCVPLLLFSCQNGSDVSEISEVDVKLKPPREAHVMSSSLDTVTIGAVQLYRVNYEIWGGPEAAELTYVATLFATTSPNSSLITTVSDSVTEYFEPIAIWKGSLILTDAPVSIGDAMIRDTLIVNPVDHE